MHRWKMAGLASACCAMGLWPAPAGAQISAPREAAQMEYGPMSLYPSVVLADAGRDSNVFDDGLAPKEDYTLTVQSKALVVTRLGLNELMFSIGADYVWFQKYKDQRSSNATYALRFNLSASRFKPFVGGVRTRTSTRPNPEINARVRRLEQDALVGADFNLTERTAISANASLNSTAYDQGEVFRGANLSEELDMRGQSYGGGIRYTLTPLTTLLLAGQYTEDIFKESHERDARTYTFAPTVSFSPDAAIRGMFMAGLEVFHPKDPQFAKYTGATYTALLNWSLFGTTSFDLRGNRNVSYSYRDVEPYYLQTGGNLSVKQQFFGPLELHGSVDRQYLSYRWRRGDVGTSAGRSDVTDMLSGGIGFAVGHGFTVSIGVEKTKRKAELDPLANFSRTRVLSTVTVGS